jgi:CNT family concentrative nucleoside transporter
MMQYENILNDKVFRFDPVSVVHAVAGIAALLFIAWLFSANRKAISWATVLKGIALQFVIALSVMFVPPVQDFFNFVGQCFVSLLNWTKAGSEFLFGPLVDMSKTGYVFVFQILPSIIFFAAFTSLLFYLGVMQRAVYLFAWLMRKVIKISGAESFATVANIFVGMNEAPLVVKPYIPKMTRSEIMMIMVAGMSTIAGGVMAAYIGMLGHGIPELELAFARHLLAASVMAAPGAVVIAKILVPETETASPEVEIPRDKIGRNALDAISNGSGDGLKLAVTVGAILLVFYALINGGNRIIAHLGTYSLSTVALFFVATVAALSVALLPTARRQICSRVVLWLSAVALTTCMVVYYVGDTYDAALCAACAGLLAGVLLARRFDKVCRPKTAKYWIAAFGAVALLFVALLMFFPADSSVNTLVAEASHQRYETLSMQCILGYIFAPVIWLLGVCSNDVSLVGQLLGQKIILTEFVGYSELSSMLSVEAFTESKSAILSAYILCGFANFASVGVMVSGISSIAPNQRPVLAAFGMRSLLGGTLASLVSAAMVGMML